MPVLTKVNALFDLSTKAISLVQSVGSGRCTNSQDVENFAEQVELIKSEKNYCTDLLSKSGPAAEKLVGPVLAAAKETLERELASMSQMPTRWWKRWAYTTLNVGDVSRAIKSVTQAFEAIPRTFRVIGEAERNLNGVVPNSLATLPFWLDNKYAPLIETLEEVQRALEDVCGLPVATLYGQPGSGKTVMAKYLAVHYDELRRQKDQQPVLGNQGAVRKDNSFSDGVLFLAYGPQATSKRL